MDVTGLMLRRNTDSTWRLMATLETNTVGDFY